MRAVFLLALIAMAGGVAKAENVLVLPFFNETENASLNWIGESLCEAVRDAVGAEGMITVQREDREEVYRRLSIKPYSRLTKASVIRAGELLDADRVVYGTFSLMTAENGQGRGTLRVVGNIVDLRKKLRGPEFTELAALEELNRLQSNLAWQALLFLLGDASPSQAEFARRQPSMAVEAIESYVRGLLVSGPEQKAKLFRQAVQLAPAYSQANFELGKLQMKEKDFKEGAERFDKVSDTDARYRQALFFSGICQYRLGNFEAAGVRFKAVAQSVPLNEVWNNLGAAQSRLNSPEALESFSKALEGDQADPDYQFNVGYTLLKQGKAAEAAERFRAVLERDPDDTNATKMLGRALQAEQAGSKAGVDRATREEGVERLKETYEESAYRQLKALLEPAKKPL